MYKYVLFKTVVTNNSCLPENDKGESNLAIKLQAVSRNITRQ